MYASVRVRAACCSAAVLIQRMAPSISTVLNHPTRATRDAYGGSRMQQVFQAVTSRPLSPVPTLNAWLDPIASLYPKFLYEALDEATVLAPARQRLVEAPSSKRKLRNPKSSALMRCTFGRSRKAREKTTGRSAVPRSQRLLRGLVHVHAGAGACG